MVIHVVIITTWGGLFVLDVDIKSFAQTSTDIFFRKSKNRVFKWSFVLKLLLLTNYSQVSMLLFKCQTQFFYFWRFILLTVTMCSHERWPRTCFLFVVFFQTGMTKPLTVFWFWSTATEEPWGVRGIRKSPQPSVQKVCEEGLWVHSHGRWWVASVQFIPLLPTEFLLFSP